MPVDHLLIIFGSLLLALFSSLLYAYWQQTFKYKTSKRAREHASETIRLSELEELIRKAVAEATLPLDERLGTLETEVQSLQTAFDSEAARMLPASEGEPLLRFPEGERGEISAIPSRKRVRS